MKVLISNLEKALKQPELVKMLNDKLKNPDILIIPSQKGNMEKTEKYAKEAYELFEKCGITGAQRDIYQGGEIYLEAYDFIYLMGGSVKEQNEIIMPLHEQFITYHGVVMGMSAGAMNMCKEVLLISAHGESQEIEYFPGIGLFDGYIDVHVNRDNAEQIRELRECGKNVYCITDKGCLVICDGKVTTYGDVFRL